MKCGNVIRIFVCLVLLLFLMCTSVYNGSESDHKLNQYVQDIKKSSEKRTILSSTDTRQNKERAAYNSPNLAPDDPTVVKALTELYLEPPSQLPYDLTHSDPNYNPSMGQAQLVDRILGRKEGGFYIECGGFDGESYSNSLIFERLRGWEGLLVEPDEDNYAKLRSKNRKAYISNTCLSRKPHAEEVTFAKKYFAGQIFEAPGNLLDGGVGDDIELQRTQCFPVYSFMTALNRTKIDYFSLDVEGVEYDILKNIPWHKVDISILSVEIQIMAATTDKIQKLMEEKGYTLHATLTHPMHFAGDFIFIKNSLYPQIRDFSLPTNIDSKIILNELNKI